MQVDIDMKNIDIIYQIYNRNSDSYSALLYPFKCLYMVCSFTWTHMSIKIRIFIYHICVSQTLVGGDE